MKNLLKIGFVAGFTLFSTLVFAGNNDNLISLKTGASSTINIELANAKSVSLYVYNSTDSEIYSEDIKSSGKIIKAYNFFRISTFFDLNWVNSRELSNAITIKNSSSRGK